MTLSRLLLALCLSAAPHIVLPQAAIQLYWTPNQESDLCCYIVCRDTIPGTVHPFAWVAKSDSSYEDLEVTAGKVYFYRLIAVDDRGHHSAPSAEVKAVAGTRALRSLELAAGYPNPFRFSTAIVFFLPQPARVELAIFNLLGQRVRTLFEGDNARGRHRVYWNGRDEAGNLVARGVYYYRLQAGNISKAGKILFWR
ncbi:MAG: T9SS type A sorting domain-containing protein [candidate division KSB1 bacterium]|nr:T9SS type A sorting domain-containing protein [candidate division KSB1 bacterium]MDZ7273626.1 T9SS type A sorting domain-containing protein [candidate division KSB1 bacterium]MDZ7286783.1 T9SS type A sorting domain-containing protein [candidate division KSB1 bacterium]MDZ7299860.1 T9SS type A sorting domain-containing protein [candidate division KSB1 bacterium]MDZ7305797.1 T9SS type A sorting domain-containing protein [candidate division KSB1 bacterium]